MASATCLALVLSASTASLGQDAPAAGTNLLGSEPFDRITLIDGTTLVVEPVSPRPLPPKETPQPQPRGPAIPLGGNVGLPGEPSRVEPADARKDEAPGPGVEITVHLAREAATGRGDTRDFRIKRAHIQNIEYFEDLLLAEGQRLAKARDFTKAFEYYLRVRQRDANWPTLAERVDELLFLEGREALIDGDPARGLRLLRELYSRKPDYPGLLDQFANAYAGRITRAVDLGLFAEGRRLLHELEQVARDLPRTRELRSKFVDLAKARAARVGSDSTPERLDAQVEALRIWPHLEEVRREYERNFQAEPTLDVAVTDVPQPVGPWVRSPADARVSRLLYLPVFSREPTDTQEPPPPDQLAEALESSDLGRRLVIRVRPDVAWSDGSREVSAADLARCLIDRCDPRNASVYQARWAELLEKVQPIDERQVEVRLNRPLLKPSAWLDGPVGPAHAGYDGRVSSSPEQRQLVGSGPFVCESSDADRLVLRSRAEGASSGEPGKVRRVREVRFDRPAGASSAFLRGDAALLAHVPPADRARLAAMPDIRVGRYQRPAVHVLALDGRSEMLRNRMLRRALSYAVDRPGLLADVVLKQAAADGDAPADGVFPKGDRSDAPGVAALGHDPILAVALASLAKGEMKADAIKLKLEYPPLPEVAPVVKRLVEAFALARIQVEPIEVPESRLESELRAGRRFDMAYRVLRCDEPVLEAGPMICPGYDAPPSSDALASAASPRILQLLLQLERAADWPTANGLAVEIDRELRDELPVIPLWQVAEHYAWRSRLKGPSPTADRLYQGIETWEIAPWIAKDPWAGE